MASKKRPDFESMETRDLIKYLQSHGSDLPDEPRSPQEVATSLAHILEMELYDIKEELAENRKVKFELRARARELERGIKGAKAKSKPFKARIKTLTPAWQRQWVAYYDKEIEDGRGKSEAAALAWSKIKIHCVKDGAGDWNCQPHEKVFRKQMKEARELKKKAVQATGKPAKAKRKPVRATGKPVKQKKKPVRATGKPLAPTRKPKRVAKR